LAWAEGVKKKICDTNPLVVVVKKGSKWETLKENLTELNITKQKNFLLDGGGIINYVSCKHFLLKTRML